MRLALLALFSACTAAAQTTLVTAIFGDSTATRLTGQCTIASRANWTAADGTNVTTVPAIVRFAGGAFSALLEPTDTATPTGQSYIVNCSGHTSGGASGTWGPYTCQIPTSATPVTLNSVCTASAPTPGLQYLISQLNVSGLSNGNYCVKVTGGVASLTACSGGTLSLASLTNAQLASLSDAQLAALTN